MRKNIYWIMSLIIVGLLIYGTYERNQTWATEEKLWNDCVKKSTNKARPYVNLGYCYLNLGDWEKAWYYTKRSIEIEAEHPMTRESAYPQSYYNLGIAFMKLGDYKRAIVANRIAIEMEPKFPMSYYNLSVVYALDGQITEAQKSLKTFMSMMKVKVEK